MKVLGNKVLTIFQIKMSKNKVSRIGKTVGRNKTTKLEERETRYEKKSEEKRIGVK